jgi:enamine deaminase RidA (YjgF/YER057c/UK114 family)
LSGCIPLDPGTGNVVDGGIEEQTRQALKNLGEVVKAGGSEVGKVVKTTVSTVFHALVRTLTIESDVVLERCS